MKASKDKIIELLITEGGNNISESRLNEVNKHKDLFLLPKKYGKVIYDEVKADVPVRNSFNPLSEKSLQINTNEPTNKKKKKYRSTTIIGDSIVRDIKQHKMRKALPENKIFVKSFSGATTECLEHYIQPSLRYKPDLIIIHCGTNDLRSEKSSKIIAEDIVKLAIGVKTEENEVMVSGIVQRNDNLNSKGMQVNDFLKLLSSERNIGFIDNSAIDTKKHLNSSNLHLNYSGTVALANNFLKEIKL